MTFSFSKGFFLVPGKTISLKNYQSLEFAFILFLFKQKSCFYLRDKTLFNVIFVSWYFLCIHFIPGYFNFLQNKKSKKERLFYLVFIK